MIRLGRWQADVLLDIRPVHKGRVYRRRRSSIVSLVGPDIVRGD